jgi:hypothetical protein
MDNGTFNDYLEDLIQQVEALERRFKEYHRIVEQLTAERDAYRQLANGMLLD